MRSVKAIRASHDFKTDLEAIPERINVSTLKKLDKKIEIIINSTDQDLKLALSFEYNIEHPVCVKELRFPEYLPAGKVQVQRDLVLLMRDAAEGKADFENVNKFRAVWKANPPFGGLYIDDEKMDLRLQDCIELYLDYLNACEHEFYKQAISSSLGWILFRYRLLLEDRNEESVPNLLDYDWPLDYNQYAGIMDEIYYRRAMDYFSEIKNLWDIFSRNPYTKPWLLTNSDIKLFKSKI